MEKIKVKNRLLLKIIPTHTNKRLDILCGNHGNITDIEPTEDDDSDKGK